MSKDIKMNYAFSLQNGFNPYINIYIFMLAIHTWPNGWTKVLKLFNGTHGYPVRPLSFEGEESELVIYEGERESTEV